MKYSQNVTILELSFSFACMSPKGQRIVLIERVLVGKPEGRIRLGR